MFPVHKILPSIACTLHQLRLNESSPLLADASVVINNESVVSERLYETAVISIAVTIDGVQLVGSNFQLLGSVKISDAVV